MPPVPEPEAKQRKTLAERAGEPYGSKMPAPTSSRPVNNAVKNTVANGSRGFSSSTSRVPSNKASKYTSGNSFGATVGPGSRAPSANGYGARPKTAIGHSRSKSHHQGSRPASSFAQHEEDEKPERKGVHPFHCSTNPKESLDARKVRKNCTRSQDNRTYSLNATPTRSQHMSSSRSISSPSSFRSANPTPEVPADTSCAEILDGFGALNLGASTAETQLQGIGRGLASGKDSVSSSSKSQVVSSIPRATPNRQMAPPPIPPPRTPSRSKRPSTPKTTTPHFLNKYTNDRCPAFDDTRVASLEAQFTAFKEQIEGDLTQQNNLKDTIKLYESRSTYILPFCLGWSWFC